MDKNKIKKKYNEKIQNLVKLNKHYYDLSKPLVHDHEYDRIKAEILSLEKQYNFLKSENSVIILDIFFLVIKLLLFSLHKYFMIVS